MPQQLLINFDFNPLPRKEGDAHVAFVTKVIEKIFQSTPS